MAASFPAALPSLPALGPGDSWGGSIVSSHQHLQSKYQHAHRVLAQERYDDPTALRVLADSVNDSHELLGGLRNAGVPQEWIYTCATLMGNIVQALDGAIQASTGMYVMLPLLQLHV